MHYHMAWLIFLFHIILYIPAAEGKIMVKPGCQDRCGSVDIPYPFGIGTDCSLEGFDLSCNKSGEKMVPFYLDVEVLNITLSTAQARLYNQISFQCNRGFTVENSNNWYLYSSPIFTLSELDNMFTVIGCDTLAFNKMYDYNGANYRTGCVSTCYNKESIRNGSCSGNGCCQTPVPSGIKHCNISFDANYNNSLGWNISPCSFAVIMATDSFNFSTSYIYKTDFLDEHNGTVPVVVDWSTGKENCKVAQANMRNYACVSNNSDCVDSRNGPGYICNCSSGYEGNPYLHDSCEDINECNDNLICSGTCKNTQGSYECICPPGTQGDPTRNGRCYPIVDSQTLSPLAKLAIGVSVGLLLLLFLSFSIYIVRQRRRLANIRKKHFQQYGGRLLLEEMRSNHGNAFTIFTEEELKEASNNFDEANLLGQGGNGTVYKGTVKSCGDVAIKKCKIINERNKKEFGKEMLILSQINHKNIVRIIGCCLEVEIPILVYEFIQKGTLFDLLHFNSTSCVSISMRIRIAQEAAEALAYMHSWAFPPIVHCDVKSSNILLDENYVAKVSDFGASALAPADEDQFLTMVRGTRGYLDPQCMQTGQLTVKSDVYSFGVVLIELLTRKKAIYLDGAEERSLSSALLTAMKENKIEEILDDQILDEENMNLIMGIAEIARECLNMEGEKRPEMRDVAEGIDKLRKTMKHPWGQDDPNEMESLLRKPSNNHELEMTSDRSLEKKAMLAMEIGR